MSEIEDEAQDEQSHRPLANAKLKPLGYYLGVNFHPHIKLDKSSGFEFAAALAQYVDTEKAEFESNQWSIEASKVGLSIVVTQSSLEFMVSEPSHNQEWCEQKYRMVLQRFEENFEPKFVLGSKAMVRGLVDIDGDARAFLAAHVMNIDPARFGPLNRPLHLLGMRIFFPPFSEKAVDGDERKTEWGVDVKIESSIEDPSKLFLEAAASWEDVTSWNDESVSDVVGRLQTISDYINQHIIAFVQHAPNQNDSDEGRG